MRRLAWVALGLQLAAVVGFVSPAQAANPTNSLRLALVMGNGGYTGLPPVPGCVASAHLVTATLTRAGYTVTERVNESNARMGTALSDFSDALAAAPGGAAVLYICGYAVGFDGRVFLLPTSATLQRPTDALTQGLVGKLPVNTVVRSEAKAGMILLDTVGVPGSEPTTPFTALIDEKAMDDTAFVAVRSASIPPQGPSTLAAAVAAAFGQPNVEIKATVDVIRAAFNGAPAANLVTHAPVQPAYLTGAPPAAPPPAEPAPAPAALPPVATPAKPGAAISLPAGAPLPSVVAPAPTTMATLAVAERRRVQLALQRLGYFKGRVTGVFGWDAAIAIRQYQTENSAPPTGQLTNDQVTTLLDQGR